MYQQLRSYQTIILSRIKNEFNHPSIKIWSDIMRGLTMTIIGFGNVVATNDLVIETKNQDRIDMVIKFGAISLAKAYIYGKYWYVFWPYALTKLICLKPIYVTSNPSHIDPQFHNTNGFTPHFIPGYSWCWPYQFYRQTK